MLKIFYCFIILCGFYYIDEYIVDGANLSIIFVSPGGKIYKYSPHLKGSEEEFTELIDMEQEVTSITCNKLDPTINRDLLVIGTKNKLLLYV